MIILAIPKSTKKGFLQMQGIGCEAIDFSAADVAITGIDTVFYCSTDSWGRPTAFPRPTNGLVLFTEGSITYDFEGDMITAKAGDIIKFPKGINYSGVKNTERNSFYVIDFFTADENEMVKFPVPVIHTPSHFSAAEQKFSEAEKIWRNGKLNSKLEVKAKIYELLSLLICDCMPERLGDSAVLKTEKIAEYIADHYEESDLSVPEICRKFYLSESTLRRMMLLAYNKTPVQYITDIRLKAAKNLLIYGNLSINDIAAKCGFSSAYYFCRIFKKKTGFTPGEFKKQN